MATSVCWLFVQCPISKAGRILSDISASGLSPNSPYQSHIMKITHASYYQNHSRLLCRLLTMTLNNGRSYVYLIIYWVTAYLIYQYILFSTGKLFSSFFSQWNSPVVPWLRYIIEFCSVSQVVKPYLETSWKFILFGRGQFSLRYTSDQKLDSGICNISCFFHVWCLTQEPMWE